MQKKIEFNFNLYQYRLENDSELLLYNVHNGQIYIIKGNTKEFVLNLIYEKENTYLDKKYMDFLKKEKIVEEK